VPIGRKTVSIQDSWIIVISLSDYDIAVQIFLHIHLRFMCRPDQSPGCQIGHTFIAQYGIGMKAAPILGLALFKAGQLNTFFVVFFFLK